MAKRGSSDAPAGGEAAIPLEARASERRQIVEETLQAGAQCGVLERLYTGLMERKVFWLTFAFLGLVADFVLPLWWAMGATVPIFAFSWWLAYRSGWF